MQNKCFDEILYDKALELLRAVSLRAIEFKQAQVVYDWMRSPEQIVINGEGLSEEDKLLIRIKESIVYLLMNKFPKIDLGLLIFIARCHHQGGLWIGDAAAFLAGVENDWLVDFTEKKRELQQTESNNAIIIQDIFVINRFISSQEPEKNYYSEQNNIVGFSTRFKLSINEAREIKVDNFEYAIKIHDKNLYTKLSQHVPNSYQISDSKPIADSHFWRVKKPNDKPPSSPTALRNM